MIVAEVIEKLRQLPQDYEVETFDEFGWQRSVCGVNVEIEPERQVVAIELDFNPTSQKG